MVIEKKYYRVDSKELVDLLIQHINEKEIIAYDTETDSLNPRKGKIIGFSVSGEEGVGFYMPTMFWNNETESLDECQIEGIGCHRIAKKLISLLVGKQLIMTMLLLTAVLLITSTELIFYLLSGLILPC
jgi:DNA polymerase I-like protein with 3'-5' exonuclease and polymerase domains